MTKSDLIEGLSNKARMTTSQAESVIDIVLDDIITALKRGERVTISGIGTFEVSTMHTGRNPKTGKSVEVSATRSAKFKPGNQLRAALDVDGNANQAAPDPR